MTDKASIEQAIIGLIEQIRPGAPVPTVDTNITEAGILDSLDFVDLVFQVQERFGVQIPDEDIEANDLRVLGCLVEYVAHRI